MNVDYFLLFIFIYVSRLFFKCSPLTINQKDFEKFEILCSTTVVQGDENKLD